MRLDYTHREREVIVSIKKTVWIQRLGAGLNLQTLGSWGRGRGEKRSRQHELRKTMYVFGPFQANCYTVRIPDIPETAWLASGSGWSWNRIFCTAVIILASHKQGSAPHQQQDRALCLSICTLKTFSGISFTSGTHFISSANFCQAHPHFLGPATLNIPRNLMMLCNSSLHPTLPCGIRKGGSWRSHKNTLGRSMPVWENTSPGSPPLSANNPHSLTSIWAPNDTGRRGHQSKYWECFWVGEAGVFFTPVALAQNRVT